MVLNGGDLSCGMKSFHEGIRPMLIGCTSWPPPPLRMSATISSDEPAYLALTLQPVCCSNGLVQSGCAYPSHATRLSWPSPGPMLVGRFGLVVPPPEVLVEEPPPQPLATSASAAPSTRSSTARVKRPRCLVMLPPPSRCGHCRDARSGTPAPAAMPAARDDRGPGVPARRCRGSAAPPPVGRRLRGRPHSGSPRRGR